MLDFCDEPYCFFEPKPNRLVMALSREVNRRISLKNANHCIAELDLSGQVDRLRELAAATGGARLLFVANHSTHSDPQVMTEVLRQVGAKTHFMAAYDVFLRSRFNAWVMQRNGAFSVDREGSDSKSMKTAVKVLSEAPFGCGLTIFPEGNVYLTNDRVTPFLDGASFIALKAQKQIGDDIPVHVVPLAFKFTHIGDVRPGICERLKIIAGEVNTEFDSDAEAVTEVVRIGQMLLGKNLRSRGMIHDEDKPLPEQLASAADELLSGLEQRLSLKKKSGAAPVDRVRAIRARLHVLRTDPKKGADYTERHIEAWADEAILAFRLIHYGNPYMVVHPTVDRFAETTERMLEDHFSKAYPPLGERRVVAHVGEPIDLRERLEAFSKRSRAAVANLSLDLEKTVQAGLDTENEVNHAEGGELFGKICPRAAAAAADSAEAEGGSA